MDRARIVDAAFALLASGGLGALSMRRLADDLGVRVNTIYWHVASKQELVARLGERIAGEAMPDELDQLCAPAPAGARRGGGDSAGSPGADRRNERRPAGPTDDALTLLVALRDRMLAVRDGGEVVAVARALNPQPLPVVTALEACLRPALGERARLAAEAAVTFAVGAVVEEQSRAELERVDEPTRARPDLDRAALFDLGARALLAGLCGTAAGARSSDG